MAHQVIKTKYRNGGMAEKNTVSGVIADVIIWCLLILAAAICLVPLWYAIVASISDGLTLYRTEGMIWWPVGEWNLKGYAHIFPTTTSFAAMAVHSSTW